MADFKIFTSKSGYLKITELFALMVAMSFFFSAHMITEGDKSSSYFVTAMIISPFIHTSFLLIVYVFGGLVIQKTLYEFMTNVFYTFMIVVASIVIFALSNNDFGAIVSGICSLVAAVAYGFDACFSLVNMGALNSATTDPASPVQPVQPPEVRSQPFTPPPVYNPPPSLAGQGPYTVPNYSSSNAQGDIANNRI